MTETGTEELERAIGNLKARIKANRQAIKEREAEQKRHKALIEIGGAGFDLNSLESANIRSANQIASFKQDISQAQTQIAQCREQIEWIERRDAVAQGVTLDANDHGQ